MNKIKLSELRAICADNGYTGDQSATAVKAWADAQDAYIKGDDGTEVSIKTLTVEDDTPAPGRKVFKAKKANADEPLDDIEAKANARALEIVKRDFGIDPASGKRPALANAAGTITSVKGWDERVYEDRIKTGQARFESFEQALAFKHMFASQMCVWRRDQSGYEANYKRFGEMHERITGKAYSSTSVTGGAATVADVFKPDLIKNVDRHGAYSQLTKVYRTNENKIYVPRNTGDLTTYWPAQNAAITASTGTYDNVALDAQTVAVLCQASNQILNDSGINFVDDVMDDMARAIAKIKDQCLLIGDGSATYGGMTGFGHKFGTVAPGASDTGYAVLGGDTTDAHTTTQLAALVAALPPYALANAKFTCSAAVFGNLFFRLQTSTLIGGMTQEMLANGAPLYRYGAWPIIVNNVMNTTNSLGSGKWHPNFTAGDAPDVLFGAFDRASKMLDLLDVQLEMDTSYGFNTFSTYFRGVARFQSVVHDVGTSTTRGPVVSLWQT